MTAFLLVGSTVCVATGILAPSQRLLLKNLLLNYTIIYSNAVRCYDNFWFPVFRHLFSILPPSITSPTSQLIPQPFHHFTNITAHSPTLPLFHLRLGLPYFEEQKRGHICRCLLLSTSSPRWLRW